MTVQEYLTPQQPSQTGNSAILITLKSLTEVVRILELMLKEERSVSERLERFLGRYANPTISEQSMQEFRFICERLWNFETMLSCSVRTALLMATLDIETTILRFCTYNLGEAATEAIKPLSLEAKLEVAHRALGIPEEFRDTPQCHALHELMAWRDTFKWGSVADVPAPSVTENNIVTPGRFPTPGEEVQQLRDYLRYYLVVQQHLLRINEHPYVARNQNELDEIEQRLNRICAFQFRDGRIVDQFDIPVRGET
jgi:hypothetical protein